MRSIAQWMFRDRRKIYNDANERVTIAFKRRCHAMSSTIWGSMSHYWVATERSGARSHAGQVGSPAPHRSFRWHLADRLQHSSVHFEQTHCTPQTIHPMDSATPMEGLQCRFCSRVFSRGGHARRHELTHSTKKQFRCQTCSKCFVRK